MDIKTFDLKTFLNRWIPPMAMMAIIFWWSTQSVLPGAQSAEIVWWDFILKKIAHMAEYGLLFYSWQRALNWDKPDEKRDYRLALLLVLVYAVSDEFHQSFTPGRHPKLFDVGFDMLGAFLVYARLVEVI